jgi:hypothetical protein
MNPSSQIIRVNVSVYGELSKLCGGRYIATVDLELSTAAHLGNLLEYLKIKPEDTSYIFLNAVLCDVPGLTVPHMELLKDSDHVGIFSSGYMWPYQYRDGMPMSAALTAAIKKYGAMHHTYTGIEDH